jgi:Fungal specific transcription factor domain
MENDDPLLTQSRYFQKYAPYLPYLPAERTPDEYYDGCSLLFWSILAVGSRRYERDPTLLSALSTRVFKLALLSTHLKSSGLPILKSLLVLLTWKFPSNDVSDEMNYVLCGSMIHLAVMLGLHLPLAAQDFSRVKVQLSEDDIKRRAEIWANCVILYQRYFNYNSMLLGHDI